MASHLHMNPRDRTHGSSSGINYLGDEEALDYGSAGKWSQIVVDLPVSPGDMYIWHQDRQKKQREKRESIASQSINGMEDII